MGDRCGNLGFYKLDEKIPMIMEELAEREAKGEL